MKQVQGLASVTFLVLVLGNDKVFRVRCYKQRTELRCHKWVLFVTPHTHRNIQRDVDIDKCCCFCDVAKNKVSITLSLSKTSLANESNLYKVLCVCSLCPSSSSFLSLDISFLAKSWLMAITVCWLLLVHLLLKDWPLILSWIKIWGVSWPWIQNVNLMISRPFSYHFYLVISRWKTCKLPPRLRNEGKQKLVNCDHLRHWSCI